MTTDPLPIDDNEDDDSPLLRFVRVVRTANSEQYILWEDETRLGQIDIHYNLDLINATLVLEKEIDVAAQNAIIDQIDEEIITSYLPRFERENFLVTIYQGKELEPYADGEPDVDDDEEEEY
ncbi:MAG: hypothetical protein ABI210_04265 [Abditibacteriaceae bacterium]